MAQILAPTQGRPIFCQPGGGLTCLIHLPDGAETPRLYLQNSLLPGLRYPLLPGAALTKFGEGYAGAGMSVAASTPSGLYDLVLAVGDRQVVNRRSVSVVAAFKTNFRFVHLSNMNVDDPTAPVFDPQIPVEVNLLAPEFIVATGDYTEWARLCDRPGDWQRVLEYMAQFDAPVYVLCGDHDHQASYTRFVANSPVGTIDYGKYHGLLLLDHGNHPIDQDDEQVRWVIQDLEANRDRTFNFVVTHSDELGLLRRLRQMNLAEKAVHDFKLKMIICGGQTDWDYREFASVLAGLPGLHYIRTAQSSTAVREGSDGQSHYRVIEVNNDRFSYVYPAGYLDARMQYSIPAGRMHVTVAGPNDGSQDPLTVNVANALNRSWNDCCLWQRVPKNSAGARPAVAGGTLLRTLDGGAYWACQIGFDLPDKGAVTLQVGTPDRLFGKPPIRLDLNAAERLGFVPRTAPFGLTYFTCPSPVILKLTNDSSQALRAWPIVRLNGTNLALSGSGPQSLPLTLPPRGSQLLRVNLTLGQLDPGPHTLQAYLLDDPLRRLTTQQIILLLTGEPGQGPSPGTRPAEAEAAQPSTSSQAASASQPASGSRPALGPRPPESGPKDQAGASRAWQEHPKPAQE